MSIFARIPFIPQDPIFGLNTSYQEDPRPFKVNLGVGSFKGEDLKPYILPSVKNAEKRLFDTEVHKEYLPIDGDRQYVELVQAMLFPKVTTLYGAQTVGGTGALKIGGELLSRYLSKKIYIPDPTWDNHRRLFHKASLKVSSYPYYDRVKKRYDHQGLCAALQKMDYSSTVLFHGACHNPTGCDPTREQWKEISSLVLQRNLIPFFDAAYSGFGENIESDTWPLNYFIQCHECLIAVSFSKSFGLYAERVGGLYVNCLDGNFLKQLASAVRAIIRSLYSNPPCHGALIVREILKDPLIKQQWIEDLSVMRERLTRMRKALYQKLSSYPHIGERSFDHLLMQKGLFSFTGLTSNQVEILTKNYGIHLPKNGRINIAGLNDKNIDFVAQAIAETIQK